MRSSECQVSIETLQSGITENQSLIATLPSKSVRGQEPTEIHLNALIGDKSLTEILPSETFRTRKKKSTRVYPKVSGLAAWSENCDFFESV
jgi:hypothetical protein